MEKFGKVKGSSGAMKEVGGTGSFISPSAQGDHGIPKGSGGFGEKSTRGVHTPTTEGDKGVKIGKAKSRGIPAKFGGTATGGASS